MSRKSKYDLLNEQLAQLEYLNQEIGKHKGHIEALEKEIQMAKRYFIQLANDITTNGWEDDPAPKIIFD